MIRQIFGSVSQFEKAMLVAKLKGTRDRNKAATGNCGGRKSYAGAAPIWSDWGRVTWSPWRSRYPVNGKKRALREIAAELAEQGHVVASGSVRRRRRRAHGWLKTPAWLHCARHIRNSQRARMAIRKSVALNAWIKNK
jgi:hypothetical protein